METGRPCRGGDAQRAPSDAAEPSCKVSRTAASSHARWWASRCRAPTARLPDRLGGRVTCSRASPWCSRCWRLREGRGRTFNSDTDRDLGREPVGWQAPKTEITWCEHQPSGRLRRRHRATGEDRYRPPCAIIAAGCPAEDRFGCPRHRHGVDFERLALLLGTFAEEAPGPDS